METGVGTACSSCSSDSQQYLDAYTNYDVRECNWATNFNGEDHRFLYHNEDDHVSIFQEIDEKGHELFERFVSRFEKHVQINERRHFRQTLDHYRERAAGNSEMFEKFVGSDQLNRKGNCKSRDQRGVNAGHDVLDKLERFKVKTVNVIGVGVVKEEEQQQK